MHKWIKTVDKLPGPYERVLVYGEEGVFRAYTDSHGEYPTWQCDPLGSYAGDGLVYGITHWMNLPNPPEAND